MRKEDILLALEKLGRELEKRDIHGEVLIVGGAAMCLAHSARDSTKDVDALFEPKTEMLDAIQSVAEDNGLDEDWLNDSVKGFLFTEPERLPYAEYPGLTITTVSPEYLLAMKLFSSRTALHDTDRQDIKTLVRLLGLANAQDTYEVLDKYFPRDRVLPKTQYLLEEIFDEIKDDSPINKQIQPMKRKKPKSPER